MHKRAVAVILSLAILNVNSFDAISYAAEYIDENTSKTEVSTDIEKEIDDNEALEQIDTQEKDNLANTHSVHNTQKLKNGVGKHNILNVVVIL